MQTLTLDQVACLADVTPRHLRRMLAAGGGPGRLPDGGFECAAVGAWLASRHDDAASRLDYTEERARLARQQRLESELRTRMRSAELIPADLAVRHGAALAQAMVHNLQSWPGKLTPALLACPRTAAAVAAVLDAATFDIRLDLEAAVARAAADFRRAES